MEHLIRYLAEQRGAKSQLARDLGLTRAAVCLWRQVPAKHVLEIERLTGISRSRLRPDLYPPSEQEAA